MDKKVKIRGSMTVPMIAEAIRGYYFGEALQKFQTNPRDAFKKIRGYSDSYVRALVAQTRESIRSGNFTSEQKKRYELVKAKGLPFYPAVFVELILEKEGIPCEIIEPIAS
jgi:hypothetical protein